EGKTPMYIAINNKIAGIIAVADIVKESSVKAIMKLHEMGIEVAMITGDNKKTADAIARQVGIDKELAEVFPQDRSNEVKQLKIYKIKIKNVKMKETLLQCLEIVLMTHLHLHKQI